MLPKVVGGSPSSEGLTPSVYIDKSSLEEILSEGGDCSYVC